jgi:hypothetical protein
MSLLGDFLAGVAGGIPGVVDASQARDMRAAEIERLRQERLAEYTRSRNDRMADLTLQEQQQVAREQRAQQAKIAEEERLRAAKEAQIAAGGRGLLSGRGLTPDQIQMVESGQNQGMDEKAFTQARQSLNDYLMASRGGSASKEVADAVWQADWSRRWNDAKGDEAKRTELSRESAARKGQNLDLQDAQATELRSRAVKNENPAPGRDQTMINPGQQEKALRERAEAIRKSAEYREAKTAAARAASDAKPFWGDPDPKKVAAAEAAKKALDALEAQAREMEASADQILRSGRGTAEPAGRTGLLQNKPVTQPTAGTPATGSTFDGSTSPGSDLIKQARTFGITPEEFLKELRGMTATANSEETRAVLSKQADELEAAIKRSQAKDPAPKSAAAAARTPTKPIEAFDLPPQGAPSQGAKATAQRQVAQAPEEKPPAAVDRNPYADSRGRYKRPDASVASEPSIASKAIDVVPGLLASAGKEVDAAARSAYENYLREKIARKEELTREERIRAKQYGLID